MGALRRAGVWLGLVEEDDERDGYGVFEDEFGDHDGDFAPSVGTRSPGRASAPRSVEHHPRAADRDPRAADRDSRTAGRDLRTADRDPRAADRDPGGQYDLPAADRQSRPAASARAERSSVRQLARPSSTRSVNYPVHDNLALAPEVQLRERGVSDHQNRRYQITTLHPASYNEARTIGERFRDGVPVIMNLTEMDEPDAKRLVDFAAGLAFGLRGTIERVTNRVFLLSPANIQVTAEDKARIAEGGFFDQG
jgi:cell division inhibitor SepF